jgi:hypothetical protein
MLRKPSRRDVLKWSGKAAAASALAGVGIEADTETNSLLVMTSTKNYEKMRPILVVHVQDFAAVRTIESLR